MARFRFPHTVDFLVMLQYSNPITFQGQIRFPTGPISHQSHNPGPNQMPVPQQNQMPVPQQNNAYLLLAHSPSKS